MRVTNTCEQTSGGGGRRPAPDTVRRALTSDLMRLGRIDGPRAGVSPAAVARGYEKTWHITERWLPLARQRRRAASGSTADQARWDGLINSVARPAQPEGCPSFPGLVELAGNARDLLRTLRDTEPPYVPVAEVAARIAEAIEGGHYLTGASLSPAKIAADRRLPVDSVKLALTDLAAKNVVELSATGRARVTSPVRTDRPQQIADWLRELVAAGAYPPGTPLPTRPLLARNLVSADPPIAAAIRLLIDDGTLTCYPGQRPIVRPGHPHAGTEMIALARAFAQLPHPKGPVDLRYTRIREVVRVSQSWWKARLVPHPTTLDHYLAQLVGIARHLITRARAPEPPTSAYGEQHEPPEHQVARDHLDSVIARITVGATSAAGADPEHRVWRIACLAAAVHDLLKLTATTGGDGTRPTCDGAG
ncbi:GntR family transcriptional regulator [Streptomyces sp. CT34]|uniref:GntR family transcriptional regulator n=1 Tax=Streptomyces sp. CT34 TaxID=1553907 RepID=UPI000D1470A6|nr:GntR family transcriptional regulator [Streptomyces sp. CT34]